MELELGLALPNQTHPMMLDLNFGYNNNGIEIGKKSYRGFVDRDRHDHDVGDDYEEEEEEVESKGLSLMLWSGQPNEEDDEQWKRLHVINHGENGEEDEKTVGWPPINSIRKESFHRDQGGRMAYRRRADHHRVILRSSMYVKVKMEGVPIGRKIDLSLFNSYRTLADALMDMFAKYNGNDSQHEDYTILYQDGDGDWMLAGDVPWESFVECVQRMEIIRKSD